MFKLMAGPAAFSFFLMVLMAIGTADQAKAADRMPDGAVAEALITGQIAAFRRDDAAAAYGFASPKIQRMFGSPEIFMQMVKQGYMAVYRPQSITFGKLALTAQGPVQAVSIVGPDGQAVMALYSLQQQPDGSWRIDGCVLVPLPDESA